MTPYRSSFFQLAFVTWLFAAAPALGQDTAQGAGAASTSICTDRPTRANYACTVTAGDFQIESDLVNWTRLAVGGTITDTVLYTNPTLKYGIGDRTDLELNISPYVTVRARNASGVVSTTGGVGDLYLRFKQQLTADAATTQVSVIPYLKAPTARVGVGNGRWEGGAIVAANIPIPEGFTLTLGPEIDVLADPVGSGRHVSLTMLTNLSHPVGKKIELYGELWTAQDLDPVGHVHQYSLDVAVTYLISASWQIDVGGNFGLNRVTPGSQIYLGVSTKF